MFLSPIFVSIIIPAYNVEKYIYKCLDSAVSQTLKEIEILVINDASTDKTLNIIHNFKVNDSRIRVIDFKENKGNGIGRNTALKEAKGYFIYFLDADDWIEKDLLEILYNTAIQKKLEM